jgi:hypothetical protein
MMTRREWALRFLWQRELPYAVFVRLPARMSP